MMTDDQLPGSAVTLLSPVDLGPYRLPNRIVMAPVTRNRAGPGCVPEPMTAVYYAQRASAGLIVTEATHVAERGIGSPDSPGIHTPEQVEGWRRVVKAVHASGGRIFLQLWHAGRISHPALQFDGGTPVAPSAVMPDGEVATYDGVMPFITPRELSLSEIAGVVQEFRQAAANARAAGFDGVEIDAAGGCLIDQFLRDGVNERTDDYGGDAAHRARFLLEVVVAVVGEWGAERVGARLSPASALNDMDDSDPLRTFTEVIDRLSPLGLAYLHVVEVLETVEQLDFAALRRAFPGRYIASGGYDFEDASRALEQGTADLVSFGTLYIANPDLPRRFAEGAPLNEPDYDSVQGGGEQGYTDYPALT